MSCLWRLSAVIHTDGRAGAGYGEMSGKHFQLWTRIGTICQGASSPALRAPSPPLGAEETGVWTF
jgi:hypothetical protein